MTDLYTYWRGMTDEKRIEYANRAGLQPNYIETHLIHRRKTPSLSKIKQMAEASEGRMNYYELCDFFLSEK